jgi:hypothetical protein
MSRETFYDKEPAKYFQGEDLPVKPKKAVHLVTYPNFLTCDGDHSQDRPFTNCSPEKKKRSFKVSQFSVSQTPSNNLKQERRKINITERYHTLSTINPLKFDPTEKASDDKNELKRNPDRNKSNLSGATAQPIQDQVIRASKKIHSGKYTDSSSMKLSLSYIS